MTENQISAILVDIFIKVHTNLGPGLLESVYETAICYELSKRKISFQRQKKIPMYYEDVKMRIGFRADIIVSEKVLVEIKSCESMPKVFYKTVLTYLKLTDLRLGLLVNFNSYLVKDGITRLVNNL